MLMIAGVLIALLAINALGYMDQFEQAYIAQMKPGLTEAERAHEIAVSEGTMRLARDALGPGLPWISLAAIASFAAVLIYLFGCGRMRLRLMSLSLLAMLLMAAICFVAMDRASELKPYVGQPEGRSIADTSYAEGFVYFGVVPFFALVPLLLVRGILVLRLWLHRPARDLPRTHRMAGSLGANLAMPQFAWPRVSAAGVAVHVGTLVALGVLLAVFRVWIVGALLFGGADLFTLLFDTPFRLAGLIKRVVVGEPLLLMQEWRTFVANVDDLGKLVVIAGVLIAAGVIWRFGKRLNLRRRDEIILKDKPPVLLLRSFSDDVAGIPSNMLLSRLFFRRKRLEEMIGQELSQAGPFVAVGRPGERLPQLGASRLYLADSEWQAVVRGYIANAHPIIVIGGKTHWVQWELAAVAAENRIARLIIVFPRIKEPDRAERWRNLTAAFDGTDWAEQVAKVDISRALAICAANTGQIIALKSRSARESDYQVALRLAAYLMRQDEQPAAPSTRP